MNDAVPRRTDSTQTAVPDGGAIPRYTPTSSLLPSVSAIRDIDQLLQQVEDLSMSIPSMDVRLKKVAGVFPPGIGPTSDVVKEAAELDAKVLDSLKSALSFVRKGFSDFGRKQDLLCRAYEKEVGGEENVVVHARDEVSGKVASEEDGAAFRRPEYHEDYWFASLGVGQRATDAEVKCFPFLSFLIYKGFYFYCCLCTCGLLFTYNLTSSLCIFSTLFWFVHMWTPTHI